MKNLIKQNRGFYLKHFQLDEKEAENFLKILGTLLFNISSIMKNIIDFHDLSVEDGHLILYVKEQFIKQKEEIQNKFYDSLLNDIWRETWYVRKRNYGNWIEIRYHNLNTGNIKTIKVIGKT